MEINGQAELTYDQEVYIVIGGKGKDRKMLTEDDHLVIFESLWHAGPLVHDLETLGIAARMVMMPLHGLYCRAEGMDLGSGSCGTAARSHPLTKSWSNEHPLCQRFRWTTCFEIHRVEAFDTCRRPCYTP